MNLSVLIVDDHMIMRSLLRQQLEGMGISNAIDAFNGSDALQKIEQMRKDGKTLDVVLADWNMPTMNGLTLLKEIRKDKENTNLAFLMITAEAEKAMILEALQAGATSYLVKPFSQEDLKKHMEKIQEWLKSRRVNTHAEKNSA